MSALNFDHHKGDLPWRDRLPKVKGKITFNAPMKALTWFGCGGKADVLFQPEDSVDLANFLKALPPEIPITVIGAGSNILVRDGGIAGVVIRLGTSFAQIQYELDHLILVGAAALDIAVAKMAREFYMTGLEFLYGIPGSIGGAIKMNAGAFGAEMKDIVELIQVMDRKGHIRDLSAVECGFSYRYSDIGADDIVLSCELRGQGGQKADIEKRMMEIRHERDLAQPRGVRTGGSTFANPPGTKAWHLIDQAGCRGLQYGGAMVSEKHCNFLINTGTATAHDIETLGEIVKARVKAHSGIDLIWEIKCIGRDKSMGELL